MTISELTLNYPQVEVSKITDILDKNGIVIIKGFVKDRLLEACRREFERAVNEELAGCIQLHKHPINPGKVARYDFKAIDDTLSAINEIYQRKIIGATEKEYYGPEIRVESCDQIFFTHEVESEIDILPWHFDRQESLKFYINLDDVNEENGAFQYDPGSHRLGHMIANYCIATGKTIGEIPNDVPDFFLNNPLTIAVNAGDLVIFDAAGFHKAGRILVGNERRVMRAHSHPLPVTTYRYRPLSAGWLINKLFSMVRPISNKIFRRQSSRIVDKLKLTR